MDLDVYFYMFGLISIIMILIVIFILSKSRNEANVLFVLTPILFTVILIFNMLNYFGDMANNFLLWFPYLLAPLGMLLSSLYILYGTGFYKNSITLSFLILYSLIAFIFSIYPNPFQYYDLSGLQSGAMHIYLVIPMILTIYNFIRLLPQIPDEKLKIYSLNLGLLLATIGSLLRGFDYIMTSNDSYLGMLIIVLGSILTLLAFANVRRHKDGVTT